MELSQDARCHFHGYVFQIRFQLVLLGKQLVQAAIKPIVVNVIVRHAEQIGQRSALVTDVPRQTALNTSLTRFMQTTYVKFPGRKCAH